MSLIDIFNTAVMLAQSFEPSSIAYPEAQLENPKSEVVFDAKTYGIDLKPKPFDPKLSEPRPKDRVIFSSTAPKDTYTAKVHKFTGDPTAPDRTDVDINKLTQTIGGFLNPER